MKTLLHVNYYEKSDGPDAFFKLADLCGSDGVELRWKWLLPNVTDTELRQKAAEYKNRHPQKELVFAISATFCQKDSSQIIDEIIAFLSWAKSECGTSLINFKSDKLLDPSFPFSEYHRHGSSIAVDEQHEKIASALQIIGRAAEELQMRVALETHNGFLHDTARASRVLIEKIKSPAIGVNYDHSNILLNQNGESLEQAMQILSGSVFYAHLKNLWPLKDSCTAFLPCPAAYGRIDNRAVLNFLLQENCHVIALENPGFSDASFAACQDLQYVRFVLQMLYS